MRRNAMWVVVGAVFAAAPISAQEWTVDSEARWCDEEWGGREADRHCEVRETTISGLNELDIDGHLNGGVQIAGWSRSEVRITAKVWANARSMDRAVELVEHVSISVRNGDVRSGGPDSARREGWGVSYEIMVPREMDLEIRTHNGGISIEEVGGDIVFEALNGGVHLAELSGDVRGMTTNGGLTVELSGDQWTGRGLDVETTNGGVQLSVPEGYSAQLETGTVNGGMDIGFPITVRGKLGKTLSTTLGEGGPLVRAVTTNGGVRIVRR